MNILVCESTIYMKKKQKTKFIHIWRSVDLLLFFGFILFDFTTNVKNIHTQNHKETKVPIKKKTLPKIALELSCMYWPTVKSVTEKHSHTHI